jgi:cell division protein FtsI (penicillin-binding protein 3)
VRAHSAPANDAASPAWRLYVVAAGLVVAAFALLARSLYLQVVDQGFLEKQGDARFTRVAKLSANRGMILDRHGDALAVSTPVDTVWANPKELAQYPQSFTKLAKALDRDPQWLARRITSSLDREFVYLVRHMRPQDAARVKAMEVPGVYLLREYRRYYPAGEVTGHLLGFTSVDDVGQEGLELAFDQWLGGEPGEKRVIQDRLGRTIEDVERIRAPRPPDLVSSIDLRNTRLSRARRPCRRIAHARARSSCSTSRPVKCSRWSTSRRSIRTTASSTPRRAIATVRRPTSSSLARASSLSSLRARWSPGASAPIR